VLTSASLPARPPSPQRSGLSDPVQYQFTASEWPHALHGVPYERLM
jgi:hypothetical protein